MPVFRQNDNYHGYRRFCQGKPDTPGLSVAGDDVEVEPIGPIAAWLSTEASTTAGI
jgi:hypothetical protein